MTKIRRHLLLVLILSLTGCGAAKEKGTAYYVSPAGNDSWSGALPEPNEEKTDGPFATLERARDAVRSLKKEKGRLEEGITVYLREGTYTVTGALRLTAEDSGSEKAPVVWRAYPGENAKLVGGIYIDRFEPVTDPEILRRLGEKYRDKIVRADLKAAGVSNFGLMDPASGKRVELFFKGRFMTPARYPNEGWLRIADVPQTGERMINRGLDRDKSPVPRGRHYGRFTYPGDRPKRWEKNDNLWVHGYWTWDWADEYLKVARIDTETREIYPAEPHHRYGYTKNQRFYFLNILEELDSPGEWYLDTGTGILYFWPPSPAGEKDVLVSTLEGPMISLEGTSNVTLRGLIFEGGRGEAVIISGGENNTIAGCTFRNFGQTAVKINGGTNNGILSCDIYDVAAGGVELHGGDRKTLTPAGNYAVNNHIHDFGIRLKTYRPAVLTTGVGNRIAHNLIHDAPHCGIFLVTSRMGNDHIIEYNELHSLAKETGDVGAIYLCARDFTMRGNIIRFNYLHDIHGPGLLGAMAIYLDDFTSGTLVYGNICRRASRAVLLGGGRDNVIENNIFIECEPSVHVDARGLGWAKYYFEKNNRFRELMEAVDYRNPPYSEKYPELLTLQDDEPAVPKYNRIVRNISLGGRWLDLYDGLDFETVTVKDNFIADPVLCKWQKRGAENFTTYDFGNEEMTKILESNGNIVADTEPGFIDPEHSNFRLKDDSPALKLGFKQIPIEKIGLFADEYRRNIPRP